MSDSKSLTPEQEEQIRSKINQVSQELQQLNSQYQYLSQQLSLITAYHQDLNMALQSLQEINTRTTGEEILIPMSSRLFVPVKLSEHSKNNILINLGSNILKNGNSDQAIEKLNEEIKKTRELLESLQNELSIHEREISRRENYLSQFYR